MKTNQKTYYLVLLLCIFCSCCSLSNFRVKWLPAGGPRPNCPCFKFARNPFHLQNMDLIDTEAIYLNKYKVEHYTKNNFKKGNKNSKTTFLPDSEFRFFRFYSNGRVSYSSEILYHFPTIFDISNLDGNGIGYYKIINSEIQIELFEPIEGDQFRIFTASISNDSLLFYQSANHEFEKEYFITPQNRWYKVKEPWMRFRGTPDW